MFPFGTADILCFPLVLLIFWGPAMPGPDRFWLDKTREGSGG
jgi:hypothetical protein